MKAQIFLRSQKSRGSGSHTFGGPDRYVAVVARSDNMDPLPVHVPLQRDRLQKRGYAVHYCGEGYSHRVQTSRSSLNQAIERANQLAQEIENIGGTY